MAFHKEYLGMQCEVPQTRCNCRYSFCCCQICLIISIFWIQLFHNFKLHYNYLECINSKYYRLNAPNILFRSPYFFLESMMKWWETLNPSSVVSLEYVMIMQICELVMVQEHHEVVGQQVLAPMVWSSDYDPELFIYVEYFLHDFLSFSLKKQLGEPTRELRQPTILSSYRPNKSIQF